QVMADLKLCPSERLSYEIALVAKTEILRLGFPALEGTRGSPPSLRMTAFLESGRRTRASAPHSILMPLLAGRPALVRCKTFWSGQPARACPAPPLGRRARRPRGRGQ